MSGHVYEFGPGLIYVSPYPLTPATYDAVERLLAEDGDSNGTAN